MHPATAEMISRLQHEDRLRAAEVARSRHIAQPRSQPLRLRVGTWLIRVGERLTVAEHPCETAT